MGALVVPSKDPQTNLKSDVASSTKKGPKFSKMGAILSNVKFIVGSIVPGPKRPTDAMISLVFHRGISRATVGMIKGAAVGPVTISAEEKTISGCVIIRSIV